MSTLDFCSQIFINQAITYQKNHKIAQEEYNNRAELLGSYLKHISLHSGRSISEIIEESEADRKHYEILSKEKANKEAVLEAQKQYIKQTVEKISSESSHKIEPYLGSSESFKVDDGNKIFDLAGAITYLCSLEEN